MIDFDVIYRLYFQDIFYFLLSLSKNKQVAEDLTSQTFFKALRNSKKLDDGKNLKAYLFSIAKNLFIDYVRSNKLLDYLENIDSMDLSQSVEQILIKNENISEVQRAIIQLDEPAQTIVRLRNYEEYSFDQIGAYFSKSSNWARVNYFRAKDKLRKILEDEYERM